jgi:hypothetical protein
MEGEMMQAIKDALFILGTCAFIVIVIASPFLAFGGCVYMTAAAARLGWGE